MPGTNSFISPQSASTSSFLAIAILHKRNSRFFAHLRSVTCVAHDITVRNFFGTCARFRDVTRHSQRSHGAVLPQATVTLKATVTREQTTQTDSEGAFVISAIPFGAIYVGSAKPRFRGSESTDPDDRRQRSLC